MRRRYPPRRHDARRRLVCARLGRQTQPVVAFCLPQTGSACGSPTFENTGSTEKSFSERDVMRARNFLRTSRLVMLWSLISAKDLTSARCTGDVQKELLHGGPKS